MVAVIAKLELTIMQSFSAPPDPYKDGGSIARRITFFLSI